MFKVATLYYSSHASCISIEDHRKKVTKFMTHVMMLGLLVMTGSGGQYQHKENLNICGY